MITEENIRSVAEEHLGGSDFFIVDVVVKAGNRITIFMDGDRRVNVDNCIALSRFLESRLDRDKEDFDLTVSSCGADRPLKLPRQFRKNTGLQLDIVTKEGKKLSGTLLAANEEGIEYEILIPGAKKKETERIVIQLKYTDIKSAKEVITFKKQ
jgi:ribosome maturation factor RimP